jgi:hypothetical protein
MATDAQCLRTPAHRLTFSTDAGRSRTPYQAGAAILALECTMNREMMRPSSMLIAMVVIAACSSDGTAPSPANVSGDWRLTARLQGTPGPLTCNDTGQIHVVQHDNQFTATGYLSGPCQIGTAIVESGGPIDIQNGRLNGSTVSFSDAECSYSGAVAGSGNAIDGTAQCDFTVDGTHVTASGTWRMVRWDFTPPTVSATLENADSVSQGDTLRITIAGSDAVALAFIGDSVVYDVFLSSGCQHDIPPAVGSVAASGKTAQHLFVHVVPACTGGIRLFAIARDTAGNRVIVQGAPVKFTYPESQLSGSTDDTVYTLGDTVRIALTAVNARGLSYVGYRWYNPNFAGADSVAVTGTSTAQSFKVKIPDGAPVTQLTVSLFARHRLGWLTEMQLPHARTTDAVRLPVQRLTLPSTPRDIVYAPGADRIYLVDSTASVREILLTPLSAGTVFGIAGPGASLDLSLSEDSLLVGLRGGLNLAVVRRSGGPVATVAITPPDLIDIYDLKRLRITQGGRTMLGLGSGSAGSLVQLDLGTGTQQVRQPWYGYGTFERTGDRSRILFIDDGSPVGSQLYLAGNDTFLPPQSGVVTLYGSEAQTSGDDAATRWLAGCQLLSSDMAPLRVFTDPSVGFGPSALATDASNAYCGRGDGVVQFNPSTGARVRAIWFPSRPTFLKALPSGRLLAVSGRELYLVTVP